jgi:hypothetical protein
VKRLALVFLAGALVAMVSLAGAVSWLAWRDPLTALPHPVGPVAGPPTHERRIDGRHIFHLVLDDPAVGSVGFTVSLPDPLPAGRLPVVVVLGGLGRGADNIAPIRAPGANAVVGFDWPMPPRLPRGLGFVGQGPDLYDRLVSTPGQVVAAIEWAMSQPWADADRASLLGFSLGALAAPAAHRLAAARGRVVGWTILAYGGAGLGDLLAAHPRLRPEWARGLVGGLADRLLRPIEPAQHLPHLSGAFLVIGGRDDRLVPPRPARRLRDLTPEPKSIVLLEGGHMGVGRGQAALLAEIVRASRAWLVAEGAVNGP